MRRLLLISAITLGVMVTIGGRNSVTDANEHQDCQQCSQQAGGIEGRVLDAEGQPLFEASVHAIRQNYNRDKPSVPFAETDENGYFHITAPPGEYKIFASKESAGYPGWDLGAVYQGTVKYVEATVRVDEVRSGVELKLGPKLDIVYVTVEDALTTKSIADANITIRLTNHPDRNFVTGANEKGRFMFVSPPTPFTIEVSAPGYKSRQYKKADFGSRKSGLDKHGDALHITSNETEEMTIALSPDK